MKKFTEQYSDSEASLNTRFTKERLKRKPRHSSELSFLLGVPNLRRFPLFRLQTDSRKNPRNSRRLPSRSRIRSRVPVCWITRKEDYVTKYYGFSKANYPAKWMLGKGCNRLQLRFYSEQSAESPPLARFQATTDSPGLVRARHDVRYIMAEAPTRSLHTHNRETRETAGGLVRVFRRGPAFFSIVRKKSFFSTDVYDLPRLSRSLFHEFPEKSSNWKRQMMKQSDAVKNNVLDNPREHFPIISS